MGKSNGNRYDEEFRQGAVKLVLENRQSIAEACRNLGVSRGTMERWLAAEADSHNADKVRLQQLENEVRQLRKEKADLEDTIDILKKAAAIFSQNQCQRRKGNDGNAGQDLTQTPVKYRRKCIGRNSSRWVFCHRNVSRRGSQYADFESVFQAIGFAPDVNDMSVVQKSVEHGSGDGRIAHQLTPVAEELVAGKDDTAFFIPFADEPEKQLRRIAVKLHISYLINHKYVGTKEGF